MEHVSGAGEIRNTTEFWIGSLIVRHNIRGINEKLFSIVLCEVDHVLYNELGGIKQEAVVVYLDLMQAYSFVRTEKNHEILQ